MSRFVLDASAVLAFINAEPGAKMVGDALPASTISAANLTEVFSKLVRAGMEPEETHEVLKQCCPHVTAVDREQAETAAIIHAAITKFNISYADCACLALGASLNTPILTGDHKWNDIDFDFDVELKMIRQRAA